LKELGKDVAMEKSKFLQEYVVRNARKDLSLILKQIMMVI